MTIFDSFFLQCESCVRARTTKCSRSEREPEGQAQRSKSFKIYSKSNKFFLSM